jgi:hypothetical protein
MFLAFPDIIKDIFDKSTTLDNYDMDVQLYS